MVMLVAGIFGWDGSPSSHGFKQIQIAAKNFGLILKSLVNASTVI